MRDSEKETKLCCTILKKERNKIIHPSIDGNNNTKP